MPRERNASEEVADTFQEEVRCAETLKVDGKRKKEKGRETMSERRRANPETNADNTSQVAVRGPRGWQSSQSIVFETF